MHSEVKPFAQSHIAIGGSGDTIRTQSARVKTPSLGRD